MLAHVAARGRIASERSLRRHAARLHDSASRASGSRAIIQATYDCFRAWSSPTSTWRFKPFVAREEPHARHLFTHVIDFSAAETLVRRVRAIGRRHLPLIICFRDLEVEALADPKGTSDVYLKGARAEHLRWQKSLMHELKRGGPWS